MDNSSEFTEMKISNQMKITSCKKTYANTDDLEINVFDRK